MPQQHPDASRLPSCAAKQGCRTTVEYQEENVGIESHSRACKSRAPTSKSHTVGEGTGAALAAIGASREDVVDRDVSDC